MLQGPSRRDALLGVVDHKVLEKVDSHDAHLCLRIADVLPSPWRPLWKSGLEVWKLGQPWPLLRGRRAQFLEDLEDRINLGVSREERGACCHLSHNTTNAPEIHWDAVERRAQKNLQRPIPYCHNFVGILWDRNAVRPGQPEIRQLQTEPSAFCADEEILGLDVPMNDTILMAELYSAAQLVRQILHCLRGQVATQRFHVFLEVVLHEFEYKH